MAEEGEKKEARIVSDKGTTMLALESMGREGDRIVFVGRMMGAWSSKMYMGPEDAWRLGGMMLKNRQLIGYIFSLPCILWKNRRTNKK
jgi:hypothetical protein